MSLRGRERGDIVIGWLVKLIVSIAIVGVVAFEAGAVVVSRVTAESAANDVANEASFVVARSGGFDEAEEAARVEAARQGVVLITFEVLPGNGNDQIIHVVVEKKAKTLLLQRISWTKSWTVVRTDRRRTAGP